MGTQTPNHSYDKPTVGGDDGDWGDLLNSTIDALDDDVVIKDTFSNRPSAGTAGRWFLATDRLELYHDTGSAWDRVLEDAARVDETATISATWTFNTQPSGINHSALSNIGASDHHTKYTDEEAQDAVGTILGTHLAYDDATPQITISDDTVTVAGNSVTLGGSTAIDHADLSNIGASDHHAKYTDEEAQDAVGLNFSTGLSYDDATPAYTLDESVLKDGGAKELDVADLAGGLGTSGQVPQSDGSAVAWASLALDDLSDVTGIDSFEENTSSNKPTAGTEGRIFFETDTGKVLYDNGTSWVDIGVSAHSQLSGISSSDHHAKYTDEEAQDAVGTILGTHLAYDDATPSITISDDTVTVAGNSVTLGGSTAIDHADLSNIGASDHHAKYTDEEAQDAVGLNFSTGLSYDDATPAYTLDESVLKDGGAKELDVADLAGGLGTSGQVPQSDGSAVAWASLALDDLSDVTGIDSFEENTSTNKPAAGTEGRIFFETDTGKVLYDNGTSWVDIGVSDHSQLSGVGASDHHAKYTDEEAQDAVGTILGTHLAYDDATPSITISDDTVTVAGNSVTLGGSTAIDHADLSNIGASDHHAKYTDEEAQDAVGLNFSTGLSYDDATPAYTLDESVLKDGGAKELDLADLAGGLGTSGQVPQSDGAAVTWVTLPHDDLTSIGSADHHAKYTDEEAQDAVGTILGTHLNYDDATPSITIGDDTVTVAGNSVTLGGSTAINHADLSNIGSSDHHAKYTDEEAQDAVGGILGEGLNYDDGANTINAKEPVSYDPGMTEWEDGLSNEEIWRLVLQSGETLVVERIEFRQKGGGSSTSASIDVRDTTAATTVGSQNLGGTTKDPGSSGSGNTIIVRVNNSTGGPINAAPRVIGYIEGA